ncbi:acyltransferase family protein [Cupriavidus taiwanensis]|uniref:acyltransferase family protein n=1 Tax=Cupriavidus taiwanensis TaxID=164546 RepID=UPI0039C262FE
MSSSPERLTAVDSLRGIAILLVLAVHISGFIAPKSEWLTELTRLGPRGVQLFYVVSAFSLFLSFAHRRSATGFSYRAYFIRRLTRIAPMFWLAMTLYLVTAGMGPNYWAPDGIKPADVTLTALFLNGWSPTTINSIVPGGWSVAIETTFYLVLPFCFLWIRSLRAAVIATALALAARHILCTWAFNAQLSNFPDSQRYLPFTFAWEFWLPSQLPVFMLGIVLFFVREKLQAAQQGLGICWLAGAAVLITASRYVPADGIISNSFLAGTGFSLLALALFDRDVRFLDNAVLRKIGEVSFSIYLLHHLVMHYGAGTVIRILNTLGLGTSGDMAYAVAFVVISAMSTALAMATYRLIEAPSIALGARLSKLAAARATHPVTGQAEPAN